MEKAMGDNDRVIASKRRRQEFVERTLEAEAKGQEERQTEKQGGMDEGRSGATGSGLTLEERKRSMGKS